MRFIGLVTKDGVDPFSLASQLDAFWHLNVRTESPDSPLIVYASDPNCAVAQVWGHMNKVHVVAIPDTHDMVQDFIGLLLVAESIDLPKNERDDLIQLLVRKSDGASVTVFSLICDGCPV